MLRIALVVALTLIVSAPPVIAGEKQITDVKELVGTWHGWVSGATRTTMTIREDGSYEGASVGGTTTIGQYYVEGGKLLYRSSRSAGTAVVTEERGKTYLTVTPDGTDAMGFTRSQTGRTEFERVQK